MPNILEYSIHTYLKPKTIWKILFDNRYVIQYMECSLSKKNNKINWYVEKNDREIILLEGEIIEEIPFQYIHIKTFNPHRNYSEKYTLDVYYTILDHTLSIKQTGFEGLPDGDKVFKENKVGWSYTIDKLNKVINALE